MTRGSPLMSGTVVHDRMRFFVGLLFVRTVASVGTLREASAALGGNACDVAGRGSPVRHG